MHEQVGVVGPAMPAAAFDALQKATHQPETFAALEESDQQLARLNEELHDLMRTIDQLEEKVGPVTGSAEPSPGAEDTMQTPRRAYATTVASRVSGHAGQIENASETVTALKRRLTYLISRIEL